MAKKKTGKWVDRYGGKYSNPVYDCSECKQKALSTAARDVLGHVSYVQVLSPYCPHCGVEMINGRR